MKVTFNLIEETVDKGVSILKEVYPSFNYKGFSRVRISKARSKWGSVRYNRNFDIYELTISNVFEEIPDEDKAKNRILSTVIHELIHTIPGCMNHGYNFKYYASLVNRKYPSLQIQRCTSMEECGVQKKKKDFTYIIKCNFCGHEFKYRRKPQVLGYLNCCRCPYCRTYKLSVIRAKGIDL